MGGIYDLDPVSLDFEPNTTVWLYSNVKIRREHQRLFSNLSEQQSYFTSHIFETFTEQTYQRPDTPFRCRMMYDDILKCNYIGFKNGNFSDKVWYGRITRKEYINAYDSGEADCDIYFELDCIQSYMFDFTFQSAFVERCHQDRFDSSGNPYINDLPEDVLTGFDYDVVYRRTLSAHDYKLVCIYSSIDLDSDYGTTNLPNNNYSGGAVYNGIPSALKMYVAKLGEEYPPGLDWLPTIEEVLNGLNEYPWISQGIQAVFLIPQEIELLLVSHIQQGAGRSLGEELFKIGVCTSYEFTNVSFSVNYMDNVPEYAENKLYNYPYTVFELASNNGSSVILKPENFGGSETTIAESMGFEQAYALAENGRTIMFPQSYNNADESGGNGYDYVCVLDGFPKTNIAVDEYLLYMANNANAFSAAKSNMNLSMVQAGLNSFISGMSGIMNSFQSINPMGVPMAVANAAIGTVGTLANAAIDYQKQQNTLLATQKDAELTPPSVNGQINGNFITFLLDKFYVEIRIKTIKPWIAEILEDYFHVFGTKRLRTEKPNLHTRSSFDYLKMTNIIIDGDIPEEHERMIKDECATGIWFWHTDDIGNFSATNGEV